MPMRPKQRIALSREARWKQKVKTWANMTSRSADSSDSTSNEALYEPSSESSEEDGGRREALLEPKQEEPSEAFDAGIGVPSSSQEEEKQSATVVLKSKVGKASVCLSGAGNSMQGLPVESATSSRDINNTACDSKPPRRSFDCTSCGKKLFSVWEVKKHPDLEVGICIACYNFLFSSPYTKDSVDCSEEQCRWCGQGGRIVMCDHCDKSFCEACIIRNYGPKDLALIVNNSNWSCFRCDPELLRVPINELKQFQHSQFSATNPFSVKRKTSLSSWAGNRITRKAREDIMSTESAGPTIAELVALEEERRKQNKGMWTNSTRVKSTTHKLARRAIEKKKKATSTELYKKVHHPATTEVKPKQEETIVEQAPASAPAPARPWIRPPQWVQKRQEAAERRKRAEAERLKNITDLPNDDPQHTDSKAEHLQAHNLEADGDQKLRAHNTQTVESEDLSDALVGNQGEVMRSV